MVRFTILTLCLAMISIGCGGDTAKDKNPNPALGEINTSPLPKRDGVKGGKEKAPAPKAPKLLSGEKGLPFGLIHCFLGFNRRLGYKN